MMLGSLCKWVNIVKGYQYRYVTLDFNQALLSYYTSKEKMLKGDRRGCVRLKGAVIGIDTEDENTFTITVDQKIFHFKAQDSEERTKWVSALEDTIFRHTYKKKFLKKLEKVPTIEEYQRKLNETNLYLTILNDQIKIIDDKIFNSGIEKDEQQLVDIKVKTLTLIDSIKHTILLLELTKDTLKTKSKKMQSSNELLSKSSDEELVNINNNNNSSQSSIENSVNNKKEPDELTMQPNLRSQLSNAKTDDESVNNLNLIPETSYSSSDDEDFFFDAEEENSFSSHKTSSTVRLDQKLSKTKIGSFNHSNSLNDLELQTNKLAVKDYDACYEDEDEDELGSLENQGSVISHIISQVKIGMDLTKVVLPTFILERRSLLEMYADFFAHPDLFCSIPDYETPEQRFIQTVKWYLSSFHAGRKSSVAKKPYNPILGETFKCFWNIPNYKKQTESKPVKDGPVPWAKSDNLCFVAEQVSHHPPVSAFYAEHVEKRIMCISHIYTKSKFLGLSIGVHHIGHGSVYLLDRGEEYICTFPSAYGRSILTVPWIELGGNVTISCAQTGYSASIDFLTKPFYGGKKHRISGEIFNPSKKPILALSGEWNGVMYAKHPNGATEVFVNTKEMPIVRKQVRPIAEQEEYESRRLWKDVTAALKEQNVQLATAGKTLIEQRQIDLVKERAEKGVKWQNRVFQLTNNNTWQHKAPLTVRQSSTSSSKSSSQ